MPRKYDVHDLVDGVPYGERRERFCGHFVETNNFMRSYRLAFAVDSSMTQSEVYKRAQELMADPECANRIREMRDIAAAATQADIIRLMQDWVDIANADPNELCAHMRVNCRHCYGINGAYQWVNMAEYIAAVQAASKRADAGASKEGTIPVEVPDCSGGFGYTLYRAPNPLCAHPSCFGEGTGIVYLADTTKLVGPARKLYAGVKQKANGEVEILMHSQEKARENLARCLGAFKDAVQMPSTEKPKPVELPTPEQSRETYLRVIQGHKT